MALGVVIVGAVLAKPVAHAARDAIHVAAEALQIAAIVVGSAVGLAVLGGLVILGVRIRRHLLARPRGAAVVQLPAGQAVAKATKLRELPVSPVIKLAPAHVRMYFHAQTVEDTAEIVRPQARVISRDSNHQ